MSRHVGRGERAQLLVVPAGGVIALMPNLEVAPFDDVNVRRGIALSLDRAEIAETASEGYMKPAGQTGLILPNQEQYLDPSIPDQGMITQDKDAALAAFAEAGYSLDGDRLVDGTGSSWNSPSPPPTASPTGPGPRRPCAASSPTWA